MADPIVHITGGIPDIGTGNITTLGQTLVDGANATVGATADLAVTAGAAGTLSAKLRSISRDLVGGVVLQTGGNVIGSVSQNGTWSVRNQDGSGNLLTSVARGAQQALSVQLVDGSGNQITAFGGGTSSSFGTAFPTTGTAVGGEYLSSPPTLTTGQMVALQTDASGNLKTNLVNASLAVTQSGTWTVQQGTPPWSTTISGTATVVQPTAANLNATVTGTVGVSGTVAASCTQNATWTVQPGNTANTTPWLATINQGGNSAVVKAASTAAAAADPSLVVNISPNSPAMAMTQSGNWLVQGTVASGTTDSGNPVEIGGLAKTTNPTAVTDGQRVAATFDKQGKMVVVGALRQLKGRQVTTLTTTTLTAITAAGGAGVFIDLYALIVTNTSATSTSITITDGTTTIMTLACPAGDTRGFTVAVDSAIPQTTAANAWQGQLAAGVSSISITALYVSNT
jgi:hypothetical protein